MNKSLHTVLIFLMLGIMLSCKIENDVDTQKPVIDTSIIGAFPKDCSIIYFGETFNVKMLFADNIELGAYTIEIHNNFLHHSHTYEINECTMDPIKKANNAFSYIHDYEIPVGSKFYEINIPITIPSQDLSGVFDEGDYHFIINVSDKYGMITEKGFNVKILRKES